MSQMFHGTYLYFKKLFTVYMEFKFNSVSCILSDNPIPKGDLKQQVMSRRDSKSVGSMNSIPMSRTGGSNFIQKYESPTGECSTLGGK